MCGQLREPVCEPTELLPHSLGPLAALSCGQEAGDLTLLLPLVCGVSTVAAEEGTEYGAGDCCWAVALHWSMVGGLHLIPPPLLGVLGLYFSLAAAMSLSLFSCILPLLHSPVGPPSEVLCVDLSVC